MKGLKEFPRLYHYLDCHLTEFSDKQMASIMGKDVTESDVFDLLKRHGIISKIGSIKAEYQDEFKYSKKTMLDNTGKNVTVPYLKITREGAEIIFECIEYDIQAKDYEESLKIQNI